MNLNSNDKLIVEVSGTKYVFNFQKVHSKPTTKLGRIAEKINQNGNDLETEVTFDRPAIVFEAIHSYYQTGILHIPTNICPIAFKQELEFWEIEPCELTGCCLCKYISALDEFETTKKNKSKNNKI
ncbi:hypothetical protein KUTeg_018713 [Tegillarca granosa]|uniref:Potassium channel tetramerisation-type BTB domain-containing protein n=1 Tax=Tegillarca granosa TaxID=220873 RepID=A0ABQ9EJU1_TEGGR|nr:hypothetical protein KUTeg_018713 [Tegillarca granosa]